MDDYILEDLVDLQLDFSWRTALRFSLWITMGDITWETLLGRLCYVGS